ncbi:MAG: hypothetical protein WDM89_20290 [Rhizomicrobium sp.]
MFGANPVIDQNRGHRLRSTTISGAVAPSVAGTLFYHSDAQGGAGEVSVDTGSAYRHAGQASVKKLTADANATYTPRSDGRIVRDSAALTADRKLTLAITNVTDGYKVRGQPSRLLRRSQPRHLSGRRHDLDRQSRRQPSCGFHLRRDPPRSGSRSNASPPT